MLDISESIFGLSKSMLETISWNACCPSLSPHGLMPARLASAVLASFSRLRRNMPEQGVAAFGGFFLFYPGMGTVSTGQLNQGCYVWCLSRCPPDVLGHTCCVLLLILLTNGFASMRPDTVYIQSGSLICCDMEKAQWPWPFLGMGLKELQSQCSARKDWAGCHWGNPGWWPESDGVAL